MAFHQVRWLIMLRSPDGAMYFGWSIKCLIFSWNFSSMWTGYHTAAWYEGLELSLNHLAAGRDGAMGWWILCQAVSSTHGEQRPGQTPENKLSDLNCAYWQTTVLEINLVTPWMSALLIFKRKKTQPCSYFSAGVFFSLTCLRTFY